MKAKVWKNPNRMLVETGHKTFDRQTNIVSTGNIIANTQSAFYVRGEMCVKTWSRTDYEPGYLRNYDLGNWPTMPTSVRQSVIRLTAGRKDSIWVSELFHYNGDRCIVHGYIITTPDHHLLDMFVTGPTYKSADVLEGVLPYVTEEGELPEDSSLKTLATAEKSPGR